MRTLIILALVAATAGSAHADWWNTCKGAEPEPRLGELHLAWDSTDVCLENIAARPGRAALMLYNVDSPELTSGVPFGGGELCLRAPFRRSILFWGPRGVFPRFHLPGFARGRLGGNPDPALLRPGSVVRMQAVVFDRHQGATWVSNMLCMDTLTYLAP